MSSSEAISTTIVNKGPEVWAVIIICLVLSWVVVGLRCYVRFSILSAFWFDDLIAVLSLVIFTVACSCVGTAVHYGIGRHTVNLTLYQIQHALKFWLLAEITYVVTCFLIKLSVVLYLLRIAVKTSHLAIIYASIAVYSAITVVFFVYLVVQCQPIAYLWTQFSGGTGTCMSTHKIAALAYVHSVLGVVTDVSLGLVPTLIVWDLQLTKRTKFSVAIILALGSFASLATIIRIPFIKDLVATLDYLYTTVNVVILSVIELGLGIIVACLATLKPLLRQWLDYRDSRTGSRTRGGSGIFSQGTGNEKRHTRGGIGRKLGAEEAYELQPSPNADGGSVTITEIDAEQGSQANLRRGSTSGSSEGMITSTHNGTFYSVEDLELAEPEAIYSVDDHGRKKSMTVEVANSMNGLSLDGLYQHHPILPSLIPTSRLSPNGIQAAAAARGETTKAKTNPARKEVGFQ